MIADLANFVPAGTNVEAVADVLLYHDFANMHEVMEVELTASDLIDLFPFDLDLVVALRVGLAVAAVARGVTPLGTVNYTPSVNLCAPATPAEPPAGALHAARAARNCQNLVNKYLEGQTSSVESVWRA